MKEKKLVDNSFITILFCLAGCVAISRKLLIIDFTILFISHSFTVSYIISISLNPSALNPNEARNYAFESDISDTGTRTEGTRKTDCWFFEANGVRELN